MSESVRVVCPKCDGEIPLDDVNVSSDIALCRKCKHSFSFAEAVSDTSVELVDLNKPPKGIWLTRTPHGFELGSSTRSAIAFFLIPFMLVWSGGSMGALYGSQIAKGDFSLFQSLFGLPFLFGTVVLAAFTIMTICGKLCIRADGNQGEVFLGAGQLGYRKKFLWDQVKDIRVETKRTSKGNTYKQLLIDADSQIGIPNIRESRANYLLAALRQLHSQFFQRAGRVPPKVSEAA